ncbi:MAG: glycosyltransferase family 39 protein, partial [Butyrivibrio sp.]|nr:glycosyltransferase family 39 protein [Butyrivibrio sp.]
MKKKYSTAEVIEFVIFLALLVIAFARLFYRLGAAGLNATDEAWYAVDTCEMLKSGNWIVPTHQYHIDIGSKPPFGLWLIMLTYKVFGYSAFSLRFYSAVSGFLTILGIAGYLYKRFGAKYAVFATAVFSTLDTCFNYHMFRAGDMDALFSLIFVVTLYSLIRLSEGEEKMMILYGVCISLGFGVKSLHVALLIFILALYFPFVYKHIRAKYVAIAALITVIPNAIWMVLRYQVDGWAFLYKVTLGELDDKTSDFITLGFVRSMAQEKVTWIMLAVLFIRAIIYFAPTRKELSWSKFRSDFLSMCKKRYISIIAYLAPIVM